MRLCTLSRTFVCCLAAALTAAGCGSGDDSSGDRTEAFEQSELKQPQESGNESRKACSLLSPKQVARLARRPAASFESSANDSTDLSICDWRGAGMRIELVLDTAPRAQLRFYNQLSEQLEYYNQDALRRPYQVKHVGDDKAYGGAGAWWTKSKKQLIAYADNRILRIRTPDKAGAVRVARAAFRRLSGPAA
jgi:hypothetical protein